MNVHKQRLGNDGCITEQSDEVFPASVSTSRDKAGTKTLINEDYPY